MKQKYSGQIKWSDIACEKDKFENQLSQILKDKGIMKTNYPPGHERWSSYTANEVCPDDYETDARRELRITTIRFRWFAYSILSILAALFFWNMLS